MGHKPSSLPRPVWERISDPARRDTLASLSVSGTQSDEDFGRVNRLAAALFDTPSSAIAVVDAERAWLVSASGTDIRQVGLENSFAAHAIAADQPLVVGDAQKDARFARSVLVTGPPHIRFYCGTPVLVRGQPIGALQVFGPEPRAGAAPRDLDQLAELAATCGRLFELKDEARVRERTAAELIKEEWRHALTLEAGKVGSWVWDIRTGAVISNDILRRMFGLPSSGAIVVEQLFGAMTEADRPGVDAALEATFEQGVDYAAEYRIEATGRWLVSRGRVYQRDAAGAPLIMMGVNIDVTEAREAADQTRLLLRELNHRVKNTLAMIQALARQTIRGTPTPEQFLETFTGRLRTLSDAHSLLSDRDWSGIGMLELVQARVEPYVPDARRLTIAGPDFRLPPDHALALGLVLHELAVNAARFGALSTPSGDVSISWNRTPERRVELRWTESGGPAVIAGPRGFGTDLIERGLDKIVGSAVSLDLRPRGVEATISFPLAATPG